MSNAATNAGIPQYLPRLRRLVSNPFPAILEKVTSSRLSASHSLNHPPFKGVCFAATRYQYQQAAHRLCVLLAYRWIHVAPQPHGSVRTKRFTDSIGIPESQLGVPPSRNEAGPPKYKGRPCTIGPKTTK
jgi:hypothetical protein